VKDKSVFVPQPQLDYSQLFFPIKGILCVYDKQTGKFFALPGADDPRYVQSNPSWSPDGETIVFARAEAYDLKDTKGKGKILLTPEECREFTEDGKPFLFDLYQIPFNNGKGGRPEPVTGASHNGVSNYFARYSPDGKWIVFCKAKSYMLLQPDSKLYIMPAAGGAVRELECNTARMNSWHSWSPNGKWLVFSSKQNTPFTQLFITHIDAEGHSTPPVLLSRFTSPDRAANIPEFVNNSGNAIAHIREDFLNDYSFVRAGYEFFRAGDADNAIIEYYKALELNPDNQAAHLKLGFLLFNVKSRQEEGLKHLQTALRLNPQDGCAHYDYGMAMLYQKNFKSAVSHLSQALNLLPQGLEPQYHLKDMYYYLGLACYYSGDYQKSSELFYHALKHEPENSALHYQLALSLAAQGKLAETLDQYQQAIRLKAGIDTSAPLHEMIADNYAHKGDYHQALSSAQKALTLAQAQGDDQCAARLAEKIKTYRIKSQ
jgi:tetratricopeptide (TPR) repeat protein